MQRQNQPGSTSSDADHLRLALLLDQMPVGIGIFDTSGVLFHSNGHFNRLTGGALTQIDQLTAPAWCGHGRDGVPLDAAMNPALLGLAGEPTMPGLDFARRLDGGDDHWLSVSAVPLQSAAAGGVTGVIVVIEDVHGRHDADHQRQLYETRFRNFVEHSNSALWIADADSGRFEYASPAAVRLGVTAYGAASLDDWDDAIAAEDRARVAAARREVRHGLSHSLRYRRVGAGGEALRITEKSFPMPDAEQGRRLIGAVLDCDESGALTYVITGQGEDSEAARRCTRAGFNTKIFGSIEEFCRIGDALSPGNIVVEGDGPSDPHALRMLESFGRRMRVVLVIRRDPDGEGEIDMEDLVERLVEPDAQPEPVRGPDPAADHTQRLDGLSLREREVLDGLVRGGTNKMIAREMGISPRTVETHRAHVMQRLNARSLPDLLRIAMTIRQCPPRSH